jgi:hypothetical protein
MKSETQFIHIRNTVNGQIQGRGGATIAYRETANGIEYAAAFCSPADTFNKAYGRAKAGGRLNSDTYRRVFPGNDLSQFREAIVNQLSV